MAIPINEDHAREAGKVLGGLIGMMTMAHCKGDGQAAKTIGEPMFDEMQAILDRVVGNRGKKMTEWSDLKRMAVSTIKHILREIGELDEEHLTES